MRAKIKKPKSSGLDEKCRCGQPADWEMTSHDLEPARTVEVRGIKKVVQPFVRYYRCDACCRGEVTGPCPPRAAVALPHQEKILRAADREALKALIGPAKQERLGEDWGLPA